MKLQFKILSGARAGHLVVLGKSYIAIGRHPHSDLRFAPEEDLEVSTRHAAILQRGPEYLLRDLGSKNGTYVNGEPIENDQVIHDGDILRFGTDGPSVEFHFVRHEADAIMDSMMEPREPQLLPPRRSRMINGVTDRIRIEVSKQTAKLRTTTRVLLATLAVVVLAFFAYATYERTSRTMQLRDMAALADSIQRTAQETLDSLQADVRGLAGAFREAQAKATRLKEQLASASTSDAEEIERLQQELSQARLRQGNMLRAAGVDYRAIMAANQDAVAIIAVEFSANEVFTGTAFAVHQDGLLVTNKHVVAGREGKRTPTRIAIKFTSTEAWLDGRVEALASEGDLAVVRVPNTNRLPTVQGVGPGPEGLAEGDPVAVIGFPLGFDLPMEGEGQETVARPTLTVGTVSKVLRNIMQIDGYSAVGASGSPVFDRTGNVVGIVYGGQRGTGGKIVYAMLSQRLERFLASVL